MIASKPDQNLSHPTHEHAYNAPNLSAKQFLLAVMDDPTVDMRDRIKAASALLRLYPHDSDPPSLKYIIPHCHSLSTESEPGPTMERTGNSSQKTDSSHIAASHSGEPKAPVNIETIIEDIRSGNFPEPTLCTRCGHLMPYPCSTTPLQ